MTSRARFLRPPRANVSGRRRHRVARCDSSLAPPLYSNRLVNMTPPYDSHSHTVRINNTKKKGTLDVRDRREIGLARARADINLASSRSARAFPPSTVETKYHARGGARLRSWRVTRARAKARCRPRRARGTRRTSTRVPHRASSEVERGRTREATPTNRSINHTSKSHRIGG